MKFLRKRSRINLKAPDVSPNGPLKSRKNASKLIFAQVALPIFSSIYVKFVFLKGVIVKIRIALFTGLFSIFFGTMAQAAVHGSVWINQPAVGANATIAAAAGLGAADAQFDVGAINFNSSISGYTIGSFLGNPAFSSVSAAWTTAGGAGQTLNNTYFLFTGSLFLNAGANSFVVPHDDGLQLDIAGIAGLEVDAPGPTSPVNTPFTVIAPSAGIYNFTMSYGEVLGPPAVLAFIVNDVPVGSIPEPETYAMLLAGLGLMGFVARRRKQRAA